MVQAIYNQNNGTQAAGEVTAPSNDEPIVLGLRSGFQNVLDTIDITKSTSKNRQGKGLSLATSPNAHAKVKKWIFKV